VSHQQRLSTNVYHPHLRGSFFKLLWIVALQRVIVWFSELADMNINKYPRITFRLSSEQLRKAKLLSFARNRTIGQVMRESLEMYWKVHNPEL